MPLLYLRIVVLVLVFNMLPAIGQEAASSAKDYQGGLKALYSRDYMQCEILLKRALASAEASGTEDAKVASISNTLGELYERKFNYELAEQSFKRAVDILERTKAENEPALALSIANLAHLYSNQGKYALAEPLYKRSLDIRQRRLGAMHPHVALSLDNLASLYSIEGKFDLAEPLYLQALTIDQKILPAEHPNTSSLLKNIISFYCRQGKHQLAEPYVYKVLAITHKAGSPTDPSFVAVLNQLAALYFGQGKYSQAVAIGVWVLEIVRSSNAFGPSEVTATLFNLATACDAGKDCKQAERYYIKAIRTARAAHLPKERTCAYLKAYAKLLRKTNRPDEAQRVDNLQTNAQFISAENTVHAQQ